MNRLPIIGITMGDPVGVGPEIITKALSSEELFDVCTPVIFGDRAILEREIKSLHSEAKIKEVESFDNIATSPATISVQTVSHLNPGNITYGHPTGETGEAMASYITHAAKRALEGKIDAIVTAPISKASLNDAGYDYPGHTEMLAHLTGTNDVVMMLAGKKLRVALVTIHCAYSEVPQRIRSEHIIRTILTTAESLKKYFSLPRPRIAVAALNPHAGENGLFGNEEKEIIEPAIHRAKSSGIDASGPYPADTLFYHAVQGKFDAVVCMYHDQGLIPLKLLHFEDGVNITLGLPIIRTSVDHGTAYDIAGKGIANPASLISAVQCASGMALSCKPLKQ